VVIAPLWYTQDYPGLAVLILGVVLGVVTIIIYKWASSRGEKATAAGVAVAVASLYVVIAIALYHFFDAGIQYMLGYLLVIVGACLEARWNKSSKERVREWKASVDAYYDRDRETRG
jgi:hypothetical protein